MSEFIGTLIAYMALILPPIVTMVIIWIRRRERIWLTIPITVVTDLVLFGMGLFMESSRASYIRILSSRLAIVAAITLILMLISRQMVKKKLKCTKRGE